MEEGFFLHIILTDHSVQENDEGSKECVMYHVQVDTNLPDWPQTAHVQRRFNDFVWLYKRLKDEWKTTKDRAVPVDKPAKHPPKQPLGRYKDDFIQKRKTKLESWIRELVAHPVWKELTVFRLFFTEPNMNGVYRC